MDLEKVEMIMNPACRNTLTDLTFDDRPTSAVYAVQQGYTVVRFTSIRKSAADAAGTQVCFTLSAPGCDTLQSHFIDFQGAGGITYAIMDLTHKCCGYAAVPFGAR